MRSFTAVVAFSALSMVAAQNSSAFTVDINNISPADLNQWCIAQEDTCSTLCDSDPLGNNCDKATLDYYCACQNGSEPGLQYYVNTVDTFVCQEAFAECTNNNVGNAAALRNCSTNIQDTCGTLDPASYVAGGSATTSAASSATDSAAATGSTAAATGATSTSVAGAVPTHLKHIGTGAAAAALGLVAYML